MKVSPLHRSKVAAVMLLFAIVLCNFSAFAQSTTIWLVRHAEKSTDNPADKDPGLTPAGQQRAIALARVLKGEKITAIYTTPYKRTRETVAPLSVQLQVTPAVYDANEIGSIAAKAVQENEGKEALIVGHSNTIIPVIKALGMPFTDMDTLNDGDYDMLFKIIITNTSADSTTFKLTITHYGEKHHVTVIPAAYTKN